MARRLVFSYTGTITADGQQNFDALDLSGVKSIAVTLRLTGNAGAGASDLLNVYLQCRDDMGIWEDRIAFAQLAGNLTSGETRKAALQQYEALSDTEEVDEISGSTGGSRLPAGTVRNGPFPANYRAGATGIGATNMAATSWRFDFVTTIVGALSFPISLKVYAG